MTAALSSGVVYPPVRVEFDPPESVDWSSVEDENLRELLQEEMRLRNYWLQSLWEQISGGLNWGGALRLKDGRPYRYDDDAEEWLSFARPVLWFGAGTLTPSGYLNMVGGYAGSATHGYHMPQDCTSFRWWAMWDTGATAAAGMTLDLRINGVSVHTWTAAGGETSMSEADLLHNADEGDFISVDLAGNSPPVSGISLGVEVAWRETFLA